MPLKQFSSTLALAVLLAGCSSNGDSPSVEGVSVATGSASAPATTPTADSRCDANAVQAYVGKQVSAVIVEGVRRATGAEIAWALCLYDAVTMDYNPHRLNIDVGGTLVIKRLSCGRPPSPEYEEAPHRRAFSWLFEEASDGGTA